MKHTRIATLLAAGLTAVGAGAQTGDPQLRLSAALAAVPDERPLPAEPLAWTADAARWQPGSPACDVPPALRWDRLTLGDALSRALCLDPGWRRSLADLAEQSAGVDLSDRQRGPRWSANAEYSAARNFNSSGQSGRTLSASLGLNWVLFDFGQRSASLQAARQTLAAAMAGQQQSALDAVRELVRRYGAAVLAAAALDASREAEASAQQTAAAAQARHQAQVGNQIDRLQAQTALAQATLERVRADGAWADARGQLALALGAGIEQPLRLADWQWWAEQRAPLPDLGQLRQEALRQHPRLRAIRAQIDALQARLEATRAENKGSLSLSASGGQSRNWGAAGAGQIPSANAAVVLNIPLFNGREADALARQVQAQIEAREAEQEALRRELDGQLWQAHQALQTSGQGLLATEQLLTSSTATFRVAQGRYKAGVGSMQDLLSAQSGLADARRQRVAALVEQLNAQTQLAVATGRIGPVASR